MTDALAHLEGFFGAGERASGITSLRVDAYAAQRFTERAKPATVNPAAAGTSKDFQFVTPLATIEEFDPLAATIKKSDGVLDVSGNERSITIKWDAAKLDETKVRTILTNSGHPVR